jgi:hypothetical protein
VTRKLTRTKNTKKRKRNKIKVTHHTPTFAEWPYRMVRLACDLCPRRGRYRKQTLIARFGGDECENWAI